MVMPEPLPTPLPATPEGPALTTPAGRVVAAAKVASVEFTAVSKRRSFSAKYKLPILAETDGAGETGGISAILRREGLYSSALSDWRGQREAGTLGAAARPARAGKGCGEPFAGRTRQGQRAECRFAPHLSRGVWIRRKQSSPSKKKWQRCWTRWIWRPAAAANHDGGRCGIGSGRRPDDGGLRDLGGVAGLCAAASHGADRPATPDKTSATCRACFAEK